MDCRTHLPAPQWSYSFLLTALYAPDLQVPKWQYVLKKGQGHGMMLIHSSIANAFSYVAVCWLDNALRTFTGC